MLKRNKKIILGTIFSLVFLFFLSISFVFAAGLENPLGEGVVDPRKIIGNIVRAMLGISGSLALAVFILGGFTWVSSAGNEEKIEKGKKMVMWAAFGLGLIFLSYALVSFVIGAIVGSSVTPSVAPNPTVTPSVAPNPNPNPKF